MQSEELPESELPAEVGPEAEELQVHPSELADKLDMTKQHVSDMERDKRAISRKTAKLLGGIFRISPARFI